MAGTAALNPFPVHTIGRSWSADMLLDLTNASSATVSGAVGVQSALSTYTAGSETSLTVYTFVLNGTTVTGCIMNGLGVTVPGGASTPSYAFAAPSAGGIPGFGYDDNQPALKFYVNNRGHLWYGNAILLDPGAAATYGIFADQGQATGISVTSSGAAVAFKGAGNQGFAMTSGTFALGGAGALATNATTGHVYLPTCAGTPTGTPTAVTGKSAVVYDTTANKIWVFNGSWRGVVVA